MNKRILIFLVLFCLGAFFLSNCDDSQLGVIKDDNNTETEIYKETLEETYDSISESLKTSSPLTPKEGYAIIVGISDYPGSSSDLSYCDDDAQDVYNMLINEYNFKPENIIYLQDSSATQNAISLAFDQITTNITENDIFFFYYSGHGGANTVNQGEFYLNYETPHFLPNNYDDYVEIPYSNAAYMRVRFGLFNMESGYDWVYLGGSALATDINAYYVAYSGPDDYWWSHWIPLGQDNTLVIRTVTDYSVESYGYKLTDCEIETYDGTHYLCPYDSLSNPSSYYLDTLLDSKLDAMNCAEKYIVSDSCYSGGMIQEAEGSGRYMMMACTDEETSLEDAGHTNGCFSYYFIRANDYATDSNADGVISMEECYDYAYSNTVSRSTSLGWVHHPQEYDGISGEAVLSTNLGSVSLIPTGNSLAYSFNLYGIGTVEELKVVVCNNSQGIIYDCLDLTTIPASDTGFGGYSGTLQLDGVSGLSGYGIYVKIEGYQSIYFNRTYSDDTDDDTLDDAFEIMMGLDPELNDTDSDGLMDGDEFYGDTDPFLNDTDNDGLNDGDEVLIHLTDPTNQDTDGDGLLDGDEVLTHLTDPTDQDTDGDGMDDYYEVVNELDPLVDDTALDYDDDGLNNLEEFLHGTSANNNDTDSDGLLDGEEVNTHNTNPLIQDTDNDLLTDFEEIITYLTNASNPDTEGDGIEDGYEIYNDLNPLSDDASLDHDSDGLINLLEFQIGSYANDSDSDDDTMLDQYEYDNDLNLLVDDTNLDYDSDGLNNLLEYQLGCYANDPDSDGDGIEDGYEIYNDLNPLSDDAGLDHDSDGLINLLEFQIGSYANDSDSDDDTMLDQYEYDNDLNLLLDDTNLDYDFDGLSNILECQLGCYANDPDSDNDGLPDNWEYTYDLNIMVNDAASDEDADGLSNINEFILQTDPTDTDTDNDELTDGLEVSLYNTDPTNPDTDGDGYSDGLEVAWGTDPLDPRISLITVYLNIAGGIILACTGVYTVYAQINKGKKQKRDDKGSKGKFPIKKDQETYNILSIKKIARPKPISYGYKPSYGTSYTSSRPSYTAPTKPITQMDIKKMRDSILYGMPPPKSSNSEEGRKAILVVNMAYDFIKRGEISKGFDFMIKALILGVPEPMNSNIKKVLLDSLNRNIESSSSGSQNDSTYQKRCNVCGQLNRNTTKFCTNCGLSLIHI